MRGLIDPLNVELDAETQAICDEVCESLEWYDPAIPGSTEMARALGVTWNWYVALSRSPDHLCRQRIVQAVEALVRSDDELVITVQGHIFTRDQISQYRGRWNRVTDSQTGETGWLLEWPTGTYAGGSPSYERPEAA